MRDKQRRGRQREAVGPIDTFSTKCREKKAKFNKKESKKKKESRELWNNLQKSNILLAAKINIFGVSLTRIAPFAA